jgi:hypothetical protein
MITKFLIELHFARGADGRSSVGIVLPDKWHCPWNREARGTPMRHVGWFVMEFVE